MVAAGRVALAGCNGLLERILWYLRSVGLKASGSFFGYPGVSDRKSKLMSSRLSVSMRSVRLTPAFSGAALPPATRGAHKLVCRARRAIAYAG